MAIPAVGAARVAVLLPLRVVEAVGPSLSELFRAVQVTLMEGRASTQGVSVPVLTSGWLSAAGPDSP